MTELLSLLTELISAPGISGNEGGVRPLIEKAWAPLTDQLTVSKLGSLHGLQNGTGAAPRPSIIVATHMDAIGLMVNAIVDGFLRVTSIGGIDARMLPGQMVTVHGRQDLPGLIMATPARLMPSSIKPGVIPMEYLLVDVGLLPDEVSSLVRVGDTVSFAQEPFETGGETLTGHTLDNRASVAALTHCLELLRARPHVWDVWAVATVLEEISYGGAITSAFQLHPSLCMTIDVTFGSEPGSPSHLTFPLGKGPTLGWGPVVHPYLHKTMKELAQHLEIPVATEPTSRYTGTDADAMVMSAEGIPNLVIGIPLRYMHTPVEMVALKDISRAGRLAAEFVAQLDEEFMQKLTWED
ncbi:MAG: aminopeptidase [Anaerolineales bacterium]|nr:M42 family peptidase [Anaerolineae bacterium]PWB52803.1 MAG: aminopeptidase [Anaerolineales bacterium]